MDKIICDRCGKEIKTPPYRYNTNTKKYHHEECISIDVDLRDRFAGRAMAAMINAIMSMPIDIDSTEDKERMDKLNNMIAKESYRIADDMMKVRENGL